MADIPEPQPRGLNRRLMIELGWRMMHSGGRTCPSTIRLPTPTNSILYQSPWGSAYANEWRAWRRWYTADGGGMEMPASYACIMRIAEVCSPSWGCSMKTGKPTAHTKGLRTALSSASCAARTIIENYTDFMLNLIVSELLHGNAYAVRVRNNGRTFDELHALNARSVSYVVADDDGRPSVLYRINASNRVVDFDNEIFVPARDMLHLRRYYGDNPLVG